LNQKRLAGIENLGVGERTKNVIRFIGETSENPKCHLHIPQFKKGIHVLNIIIQRILGKKKVKGIEPKGMPKTLMPLIRV
jgi:hypothetical protein